MRTFSIILLAGLFANVAVANAFEMKPIQATQIELGDIEGIAYFDLVGDTCRLVATMAQQQGTPIQVTAILSNDERLTISVPGPVGYPAQEIGFTRRGEVVEVTASAPTSN